MLLPLGIHDIQPYISEHWINHIKMEQRKPKGQNWWSYLRVCACTSKWQHRGSSHAYALPIHKMQPKWELQLDWLLSTARRWARTMVCKATQNCWNCWHGSSSICCSSEMSCLHIRASEMILCLTVLFSNQAVVQPVIKVLLWYVNTQTSSEKLVLARAYSFPFWSTKKTKHCCQWYFRG